MTDKKKVPVVCLAGCAVVSVFGSGNYDRKKKFQLSVWRVVLLCQFLVLAGNRHFFVVAGKFYYDRKKNVPVICLAGCAVVSVFGSGGKSAFLLLWRESSITTGKKVPVVWQL